MFAVLWTAVVGALNIFEIVALGWASLGMLGDRVRAFDCIRTDFPIYEKPAKSGLTGAVVLVMVLIASEKTIFYLWYFRVGADR